jgi:hypothetical protein
MGSWVFSVVKDKSYAARQKFEIRMGDRFWGLSDKARNVKNIHTGDEVIFYIGSPEQAFGGTARLASGFHELTTEERAWLPHNSGYFDAKYGVWLEDIKTWEHLKPIAELDLESLKTPLPRGSIHRIDESDYSTIVSGTISAEHLRPGSGSRK